MCGPSVGCGPSVVCGHCGPEKLQAVRSLTLLCAKIVGFIKNLFTLSIFCLLSLRTMSLHKAQVPVQFCAGLCEISKESLWNPKKRTQTHSPNGLWSRDEQIGGAYRKNLKNRGINPCFPISYLAYLALAMHGLWPIWNFLRNFCQKFFTQVFGSAKPIFF